MSDAAADEASDSFYTSNCSSYNSSRSSSNNSEISMNDLSNISNVAALCADMYDASFTSQPIANPIHAPTIAALPADHGFGWTDADLSGFDA